MPQAAGSAAARQRRAVGAERRMDALPFSRGRDGVGACLPVQAGRGVDLQPLSYGRARMGGGARSLWRSERRADARRDVPAG